MVSGEARFKMSGKEFILKKGDAVLIPKGTVHWAENLSPEGSEALVVFSPALVEPDYQELGKQTL
jgi:quercetin dioxygenase-like cupin family protein